jgi:beta-mannosidase
MRSISRRSFLKQSGQTLAAGISTKAMAAKSSASATRFEQKELANGWRLKSIPPCTYLDPSLLAEAAAGQGDDWLTVATMPAMVHDVLLSQGHIETPWLPGRAEKCRPVAEQDWIYATTFTLGARKRISRLRFLGIDTIVDVYLNGERLASHSNMYLPLEVDVSDKLHSLNTLVLHFHTVFDFSGGKPTPIQFVNGDRSRPVRRPEQNYVNYLGPYPYFSRIGVYDRILFETSDEARLTEVVAGSSLNESLTQGEVRIDVAGACRVPSVDVRLRLLDAEGRSIGEKTVPAGVQNGSFTANIALKADSPKLWWPRGYGSQPLYKAEVTLLVAGRPIQSERRTIGFRRITMPEHLHFVVNNVPVKLWGSDWVTPDWQTEVWNQSRVEKLLALAENANINAIRVWGEVVSPRDNFYELADAHGFLLWQDFTDLPLLPDETSRAICRRESELFLKRLKHHPAIFCWCGKNEAALWHSKDYRDDFRDHGPWPGLAAGEEVGAICKRLDPERYYQPSTPYGGAFPNDPQGGNTHGYTNIWFVPGYDYVNFASEDTRISAPTLESIKKFMAPEDLWPDSCTTMQLADNHTPYPKTWLKYTTSESWKKAGPVEQFYDTAEPAGMVYRLGMAASLYYRDTIERQRRGRDATDTTGLRRCGGYLAWKFHDSWPQVYSAKVDYFLEPYHVYYALRRAYSPVLLSFDIGTYIYAWVVNDSTVPVSGTVKIRLLHLERNEFTREITREVTVPPGESSVVVRLDQAGIESFRREHILVGTFTAGSGQVLAQSCALTEIERNITFPDARLGVQYTGRAITLTTDKFAHCVTLEGEGGGWFFDDNYFDLVPGEAKVVRILGDKSRGRIRIKPWYSSQAIQMDWLA